MSSSVILSCKERKKERHMLNLRFGWVGEGQDLDTECVYMDMSISIIDIFVFVHAYSDSETLILQFPGGEKPDCAMRRTPKANCILCDVNALFSFLIAVTTCAGVGNEIPHVLWFVMCKLKITGTCTNLGNWDTGIYHVT